MLEEPDVIRGARSWRKPDTIVRLRRTTRERARETQQRNRDHADARALHTISIGRPAPSGCRLRRGPGRRRAIPLDGATQPFLERDDRLVAEDAARLGDVGLRVA